MRSSASSSSLFTCLLTVFTPQYAVPSVAPSSVWDGDAWSVQMASVAPATPGVEGEVVVGQVRPSSISKYFSVLYYLQCQGCKTLQFFYQNPVDDIKIGFPPVRVNTEEEVNCVVALVTEKAEEFNR